MTFFNIFRHTMIFFINFFNILYYYFLKNIYILWHAILWLFLWSFSTYCPMTFFRKILHIQYSIITVIALGVTLQTCPSSIDNLWYHCKITTIHLLLSSLWLDITTTCLKSADFANKINLADEHRTQLTQCFIPSPSRLDWVMTKWSKAALITIQMAKVYN